MRIFTEGEDEYGKTVTKFNGDLQKSKQSVTTIWIQEKHLLTEHLTRRIKKRTKGYENGESVIEDYEICCDTYLKARFIEFNTSIATVLYHC